MEENLIFFDERFWGKILVYSDIKIILFHKKPPLVGILPH